jgi:hypothetical protein
MIDLHIIVKPDTVIKWHREGFRLYWRWKSKAPIGRPTIDKEICELIRRISCENPLWGAPRIQSVGLSRQRSAERVVGRDSSRSWSNPVNSQLG